MLPSTGCLKPWPPESFAHCKRPFRLAGAGVGETGIYRNHYYFFFLEDTWKVFVDDIFCVVDEALFVVVAAPPPL